MAPDLPCPVVQPSSTVTKPLRILGANQVDLGGIMLRCWQTSTNCAIVTGGSASARLNSPESTRWSRYVASMSTATEEKVPRYGPVRSPRELGQLVRLHRKSRGWTLQKLSRFANVSMRFLSEFERGKETAEIGKAVHVLQLLGLEAVIVPRREIPASLRRGARVD